jgi:hypothetical protein
MQHAGIFHIALSCWALVSFGPQVCKGYGSFTFFLIYILGGVSGNLASFLHTPDPTVGGTVSITLQQLIRKITQLRTLIDLGRLIVYIHKIIYKMIFTINLRSNDQNQ